MSPFARIALDRDAEVPLGTQLAWALRARITGGQLRPGERLPGARELAAQIGVNVNTVRTVFARLEDEGLLLIAHGRGTFVADAPAAATGAAGGSGGAGTAGAAALAAAVTSEARRRGIDPRAVAAALYVQDPAGAGSSAGAGGDADAIAASSSGAEASADAEVRRALRAEIAALERRLATLPAAPLASPDAGPDPSVAGRLLSTEELTQERDALVEQVREHERNTQPETDSSAPAERSTVTRAHGAKLRWVPSS